MDSHYHLHNEWAVAGIAIDIARQDGIPYLRIARNWAVDLGFGKWAYKAVLNRRIGHAGLRRTTYFGSLVDHLSARELRLFRILRESWEVMIHVRRREDGRLVSQDWDSGTLDDAIRRIDPDGRAVSFSGERYPR
jgi:hypothetical protein